MLFDQWGRQYGNIAYLNTTKDYPNMIRVKIQIHKKKAKKNIMTECILYIIIVCTFTRYLYKMVTQRTNPICDCCRSNQMS